MESEAIGTFYPVFKDQRYIVTKHARENEALPIYVARFNGAELHRSVFLTSAQLRCIGQRQIDIGAEIIVEVQS